jgi:hypothetical protein
MISQQTDWEAMEKAAEAVHEAYLETCNKLGWSIKPENMVPYSQLSEDSKELDRASVRATMKSLQAGFHRAGSEVSVRVISEELYQNVLSDLSLCKHGPSDFLDEFRNASTIDIPQQASQAPSSGIIAGSGVEIGQELLARIIAQLQEYDNEAHSASQELGAGSHIENCQMCADINALRSLSTPSHGVDLTVLDVRTLEDWDCDWTEPMVKFSDIKALLK